MRRSRVLALVTLVPVVAHAVAPDTAEAAGDEGGGDAACTAENGDVNADGGVNVSDAITILGHLFLGNPTALAPLCRAPAGPGGLPDTGQTTCYDCRQFEVVAVDCRSDICAGQDGFYETGCPPEGRFVNNGDGTVTDNCTGLMWQKDVAGDGNGLDWCSALAYCEALAFAGHDDWRLPNVRELLSIVDYGRADRAFDPVFGVAPAEDRFWSSTSALDARDRAWRVQSGYTFENPKTDRLVVRPVRSAEIGGWGDGGDADCAGENGDVDADGEVNISDAVTILGHLFLGNPTALPSLCSAPGAVSGLPDTGQRTCYDSRGGAVNCESGTCAGQDGFYESGCSYEGRFVDNGDGTVTDNCAGSMWQKDTGNNGRALQLYRALAYCESLELAGHDDWRLPNIRELQSICDYGRMLPALHPVFRDSGQGDYWSSTKSSDDTTAMWVINPLWGTVHDKRWLTDGLVRAVRNDSRRRER